MDPELEKITRRSEAALRSKEYDRLIKQSYEDKVHRSLNLVDEFVSILGLDRVYVATSGGKDSACLSKLCKQKFPQIKHYMFDTGLEYQATLRLAKKQGAIIIKPTASWIEFCEKEGYPVGSKQVSKRLHDVDSGVISCCISLFSKNYGLSNCWLHFLDRSLIKFPISHKCCNEFKKKPGRCLKLNPIIGTRTEESSLRKSAWRKSGCNSFSIDYTKGVSRPISLWTNQDVEQYIVEESVELSEIYTQYEAKRTGCVNCPYGAQLDGSRFDLLKRLEPQRYDHFMNHSHLKEILAYSNVDIGTDPEYMAYKKQIQKIVARWHEKAKGDDQYLTWKLQFALERYSSDELRKGIEHISKYPMKVEKESILLKLQELERTEPGTHY